MSLTASRGNNSGENGQDKSPPLRTSSSQWKDPSSSWLTLSSKTLTQPVPAVATGARHNDENIVIENLALVSAMDKLKTLVLLYDGDLYKKSRGLECFMETFAHVFDKNNHKSSSIPRTRYNDDFVEQSYQESLQDYLTLFHAGVRADIIEFKVLAGGMMVEFNVQVMLKHDEHEQYIFQSTAMVNPISGKLVLVERRQASANPAPTAHVDGSEICSEHQSEQYRFLASPSCGWGSNMVLCPDEDGLRPSRQAGIAIQLRLVTVSAAVVRPDAPRNRHRLRLPQLLRRRHQSTTIRTAPYSGKRIHIQQVHDQRPYAGGLWIEKEKHCGGGTRFMLHNQLDIPIALCQPLRLVPQDDRSRRRLRVGWARRPRNSYSHAYNIMGRHPMHACDVPNTSQFYPWYRVIVEKNHHHGDDDNNNNAKISSSCTTFIWNGSQYEPIMTTTATTPLGLGRDIASPSETSVTVTEHDETDQGLENQRQEQRQHDKFIYRSSSEPELVFGSLTMCAYEREMSTMETTSKATPTGIHHAAPSASPSRGAWALTINPGLDPALMICLAAVMMEWSA